MKIKYFEEFGFILKDQVEDGDENSPGKERNGTLSISDIERCFESGRQKNESVCGKLLKSKSADLKKKECEYLTQFSLRRRRHMLSNVYGH